MEVSLYNSNVCRLCGEENNNGTFIFKYEENNQTLCDIINTYLPIKVSDDGQLPRTICPGCSIQLEATVEFINLIINGQKIIRDLHQAEKEYNQGQEPAAEIITENIIYEISTDNGVYHVEHPISLQVSGLEKPKRKRGRPPKKPKTEEELKQEAVAQEIQQEKDSPENCESQVDEVPGKRRRKTPKRFKEVVQGKELERIYKEEGIDGDSDGETKPENDADEVKPVVESKEAEVIGHLEESGEPVVVVKGKGRGRPKGRLRPTREQCAICGQWFTCVGRYMSHVAAHGPVRYQCAAAGCALTLPTRLAFTAHQRAAGHAGQRVIPCEGGTRDNENADDKPDVSLKQESESGGDTKVEVGQDQLAAGSLPELGLLGEPEQVLEELGREEQPPGAATADANGVQTGEPRPAAEAAEAAPAQEAHEAEGAEGAEEAGEKPPEEDIPVKGPKGKVRWKCNHCDKTFGNKQNKSLHVKAVHLGERAYACAECGARFAYPRSLALHGLTHRRAARAARGFACDLCGKVLNHPSSVVYHKAAEHAGQRYVCGKCGKSFKHKQLLQRHQLVHSQTRPFSCKTCGASFKTKTNLLNHQLLHSGEKRHACAECKQRFAHKTSLTLHMRWHSGTKPYSCATCGKRFSQRGNLSEHARTHTGEKPYQCAHCPRRFTTSSQRRLHARRHLPPAPPAPAPAPAAQAQAQAQPRAPPAAPRARPHACPRCPRRFASRAACLAHQRRDAAAHEGGGSPCAAHRCAWCGRGFAERWALAKHARRHTGERPYRCPHCPRAFADCSNLNKHKKHVHKQISLLVNEKQQPLLLQPQQQEPSQQQLEQQQVEQLQQLERLQSNEQQQQQLQQHEENQHQLQQQELEEQQQLEHQQLQIEQQQLQMEQQQHQFLLSEDSQNVVEERIIFVTYDESDPPAYHILDSEIVNEVVEMEGKELPLCELYAGPSMLASPPPEPPLEPPEPPEPLSPPEPAHITVTDEAGNPLYFTMADGSRLAITSADGKSLQVVTHDGLAIPVEIKDLFSK